MLLAVHSRKPVIEWSQQAAFERLRNQRYEVLQRSVHDRSAAGYGRRRGSSAAAGRIRQAMVFRIDPRVANATIV